MRLSRAVMAGSDTKDWSSNTFSMSWCSSRWMTPASAPASITAINIVGGDLVVAHHGDAHQPEQGRWPCR